MRPLISITTTVRDTGPILDEFLERIAAQDIKWSFELVILYFGIGEETLRKLRKHASKIVKIPPEEYDCGRSRDLACGATSGEYIVNVSVDALPMNSNWLRELVSPLVLGKADVVQGEIRCPDSDDSNYQNFFYWEKDYILYYSSEEKEFLKKYGKFGFSCVNLAFRKKVWENAKFTEACYCEDKIFQKRVSNLGYISIYNPKAIVLHAHSYTSIKELFQRIANEGLGWRQVGESYGASLFIKDLFRFDMHLMAIKTLLQKKLKYNSEILFFFIRPLALYWGNNFLKKIYK